MTSLTITVGAVVLAGCAALGFGLAMRAESCKTIRVTGFYSLACWFGALSLYAIYALPA